MDPIEKQLIEEYGLEPKAASALARKIKSGEMKGPEVDGVKATTVRKGAEAAIRHMKNLKLKFDKLAETHEKRMRGEPVDPVDEQFYMQATEAYRAKLRTMAADSQGTQPGPHTPAPAPQQFKVGAPIPNGTPLPPRPTSPNPGMTVERLQPPATNEYNKPYDQNGAVQAMGAPGMTITPQPTPRRIPYAEPAPTSLQYAERVPVRAGEPGQEEIAMPPMAAGGSVNQTYMDRLLAQWELNERRKALGGI